MVATRNAELARQEFAGGGKSLQEIDDFLKQAQVFSSREGKVVSVRLMVVPETGRVGVEWVVNWDRPYPPSVKLALASDSVDEWHVFRGIWVRTLRRDRTHKFILAAYDGNRQLENLQFSIHVPTLKQWQRQTSRLPDLSQEALSEKNRQELRALAEMYLAGELDKRKVITEAKTKLRESGFDLEDQMQVIASLEAWFTGRGNR